ncbi:hypothetical protein NIES3275_19490 [Microchaete diplosiphon NIES-3275]|nr:hypothetical protein NIES3275_19490 [Microchaete diplosiphon NIES-3275]
MNSMLQLLHQQSVRNSVGIGDWGLGIGDWGLGTGDWENLNTDAINRVSTTFDSKYLL